MIQFQSGRKAIIQNIYFLKGDGYLWQPSEWFVKMEYKPKYESNETSRLLQMGQVINYEADWCFSHALEQ